MEDDDDDDDDDDDEDEDEDENIDDVGDSDNIPDFRQKLRFVSRESRNPFPVKLSFCGVPFSFWLEFGLNSFFRLLVSNAAFR